MKCRLVLPVGLLTFVLCLGGVRASAFELFRLIGEEAAVEAPAPIAEPIAEPAPIEDGKYDAGQKGSPVAQKGFGSPCQKGIGAACQKGCDSFALPCRPRPWGCWARAYCAPACGMEMNVGACQKDFGPACQKGCGPVSQKGCALFASPCRPRLRGWGKACGEPACGVEMKGGACQKDFGPACQKSCGPVAQKGCESFAMPCYPRFWGSWGKGRSAPACGVEMKGEVVSQKDCGPACQKDFGPACQKGPEQK